MKCGNCKGTGRVYSAGANTGRNADPKASAKILCPACRGTGFTGGRK